MLFTVAHAGLYQRFDGTVELALWFVENTAGLPPSSAHCFRKVTPPEADEFDRETIALLNGRPVPVLATTLNRPEAPRDPGASSFPGTRLEAGAGGVVNSVHGEAN
jgi:hypothetical protein